MSYPPFSRSSPTKNSLRADDGRLLRGDRARAKIRAAAKELFQEKGFDGATLREIAARAGMGVSSLYRHICSKEELVISELAHLQERAWTQFRREDDRTDAAQERVQRWLRVQHELLCRDPDFSRIALRATTHPRARVARDVLALHDRSIGLLAEILLSGRMKRILAPEVDIMRAAQALFYITQSARVPWANGLLSDEALMENLRIAVDLLFHGIEAREREI